MELLPGISDAAVRTLEQCFIRAPTNDNHNCHGIIDTTTTTTTTAAVGHSHSLVSPPPYYALRLFDSDDNEGANMNAALKQLPMAPVEFICGSWEDPYVYFGDADIVFVFSSCMGSDSIQDGLAKAIGRQCKPGTIVITTDYMLPLEGTIAPYDKDDRIPSGNFKLGLIEQIDGWCWLTGGVSTAFIHKVEVSLWEEGQGKLERPEVSLEDKALEVVRALEAGELTDSKVFLRNVYNNMIFHGFPESLLPKRVKDD